MCCSRYPPEELLKAQQHLAEHAGVRGRIRAHFPIAAARDSFEHRYRLLENSYASSETVGECSGRCLLFAQKCLHVRNGF